MVNIAVLKVDPRGRVGIPTTFLKSNGLNPSSGNCVAVMKPKYNTAEVEITLEFIEQVETNGSITTTTPTEIEDFSATTEEKLPSFNDVT
jgi:hypothetical protein|tara:strand:+ start:465 stop:734 length:270 start_codon:yes stop_codon:yes gene_type:complete